MYAIRPLLEDPPPFESEEHKAWWYMSKLEEPWNRLDHWQNLLQAWLESYEVDFDGLRRELVYIMQAKNIFNEKTCDAIWYLLLLRREHQVASGLVSQ